MKRFVQILAIFAVLFCSFSISYASHWQWIDSNDKVGYFFDTENIRYESIHNYATNKDSVDTTKITTWIKIVYTQAAVDEIMEGLNKRDIHNEEFRRLGYEVYLETISLTDKTYITHEEIWYAHDGSVLSHRKKETSSRILPDTWGEAVFKAIREYARTHHDQLIKNTYGN